MKQGFKPRGRLRFYIQWPLYLSVFLFATNVAVFVINNHAGAVMCIYTAIYLVVAISLYLYQKPLLMKDLLNFAIDYTQVQKSLLKGLTIPYGIIDENGYFLWMNETLTEVVGKDKGRTAQYIFPELKKSGLPEGTEKKLVQARKENKYYRLELQNIQLPEEFRSGALMELQNTESGMIALYIFDETETRGMVKELEDQRMVAGLIYVDNYDEALETIDEARRAVVSALIDRKVNKCVSGLGGVVKKLEKDKYFMVLKQQAVGKLQEDHFYLLEEVKTINMGGELPVTLSIGLGLNADTFEKNYDYARIAIDMALGRGGDQAVIKNGENVSYFGGKSQQLEKNTRVKARVKAHALRELFMTRENVFIMGHQRCDNDCFGAAIGLYRAASAMDTSAHIVLEKVLPSMKPIVDKFINNPDYPADLFITGEAAMNMIGKDDVLIVVDVNRPVITECPELLDKAETVVVFDHHRQSRESIENAELSYVEPYASSTCELIAEIMQYIRDDIRLKPVEADAMYAGIVIDTNNFLNKAGVRTFEAAAYLRRNGADITRIRKLLRDTMEDHRAKAEVIHSAEIFEKYFAISTYVGNGTENATIIGAQAADELLSVIGIKASIVLTEAEGKITISARAIDEVNVQLVMERLGGGGHINSAGAQMVGCSLEEAKEYVKVTIKQMLEEGEI